VPIVDVEDLQHPHHEVGFGAGGGGAAGCVDLGHQGGERVNQLQARPVGADLGPGTVAKLTAFGSGMPHERRIVPEALHTFAMCGKAVFKFVACSVADLNEIADLEQDFQFSPVWVVPSATTHDEVVAGLRTLAEPVLARGWT
jgi:hypothetical protein